MPVNDRFLGLFLDEARELLQSLEAGLMDLEARRDDREHLDRTFRAAHTLKGAAGMVGLRAIAEFTHAVEAVLDKVRSGGLEVTPETITLLLRSRDHLGAAIEAVAGGAEPPPPPAGLMGALDDLAAGRAVAATTAQPAPVVAERVADEGPATVSTTYRIVLTPRPDLWRQGIDPLGFLDELRDLGPAVVTARDDRVPPLGEINPRDCYLAWTIDLTTDAPRSRIDGVFLFLEDRSQVTIEALDPAAAEAPRGPVLESAGPAAAPGSSPPRPSASARVRVDAERLDQLVGIAGELAVLTDSLQGLAECPGAAPWAGTLETLERLGRLLRDATLELRMVPIEELFARFPRLVRDLAERSGKRIELRMEGADTQLDRTIIERLADPMIHLIRNAIDHGLETPEERRAAGKGPVGRIVISAGHEGDRVAIRIRDDGRGLDRARVLAKGVRLGLLPADTSPDDPRVGNLIFEAGFSTRDQVGELSGRGVGLDVVRDTIRSLRGSVSLNSREGRGTTFLLRLPLTLAMVDGLLVEADGGRYVVPISQVDECVSLPAEELISTFGRPAAIVRGDLVPILPLGSARDRADGEALERRELLLTRHDDQRVAVAVDHLVGRVQTVIQPIDPALGRHVYSGATILGDGSVSLVLDLGSLIADARDDLARGHPVAPESQAITSG